METAVAAEENKKAGVGGSGEIVSEAEAEVSPSAGRKSVRTLVPEVEIHVYRQGKGPVDVSKWRLGGWDQDQLEVRDILDRYGFKSIHAFNPNQVNGSGSGRGAPIRFNPRNGRSLLPYKDGAVIYIDGDPKDSLLKPITQILLSVALITLLISFLAKEPPSWIQKLNIGGMNFNPWIIACMVIVFTRMRKRTKDFLKKYGW
ncbi:hypothetical protein MLD38_022649 [Melastoma candidum]|uniref:Uncharacterized protein n=1 Tax=Melastoma candidum TaxID=119954 RepID=A0ACB9QN01_9MYRT|nr:hypothetical protein MLD38_022649 [Melastoma candidum]